MAGWVYSSRPPSSRHDPNTSAGSTTWRCVFFLFVSWRYLIAPHRCLQRNAPNPPKPPQSLSGRELYHCTVQTTIREFPLEEGRWEGSSVPASVAALCYSFMRQDVAGGAGKTVSWVRVQHDWPIRGHDLSPWRQDWLRVPSLGERSMETMSFLSYSWSEDPEWLIHILVRPESAELPKLLLGD